MGAPHSIAFQLTIHNLRAFTKDDLTWFKIFGSDKIDGGGSQTRWWLGAIGQNSGGQLVAWDGARSGEISGSVETGIFLQEGKRYAFRVDVIPSNQSCIVTIDDGENSFESPALGWRTASKKSGGHFTLNTQINNDKGEALGFTISDFEVRQLPQGSFY